MGARQQVAAFELEKQPVGDAASAALGGSHHQDRHARVRSARLPAAGGFNGGMWARTCEHARAASCHVRLRYKWAEVAGVARRRLRQMGNLESSGERVVDPAVCAEVVKQLVLESVCCWLRWTMDDVFVRLQCSRVKYLATVFNLLV